MGSGLFQVGARLAYAIDLGKDLALVLHVFAGHRVISQLLVLQIVIERHQVVFAGVEQVIHPLLLIWAQVQAFDGLLVVPEAQGWGEHRSVVYRLAGGDVRPTKIASSPSHAEAAASHSTSTTAAALRVRQRGAKQQEATEQERPKMAERGQELSLNLIL